MMNALVVMATLAIAGPAEGARAAGLPATDLALTMTDSPDPVGALFGAESSHLTYHLTVSNLGPIPGVEVVLTIPPPQAPPGAIITLVPSPPCIYDVNTGGVTCDIGEIGVGASVSAEASFVVGETAPALLMSGVATLSAATPDPDPSNNSASVSTTVVPTVGGNCQVGIVEGDAGLTPALCFIYRHGDQVPISTVTYAFGGGTATPGVDFVPSSGVVTFGVGETEKQVSIEIIGDTLPEPNDSFRVQLANPVGAVVLDAPDYPWWDVIYNDDRGGVVGELSPGFIYRGPVPSHATERVADVFDLRTGPGYGSYEVVLDEVSGDASPLRPATGSITAGQGMLFGVPTGTGGASSLRIPNFHVAVWHRTVMVVGDGCNADCGPDDTYRLRFYETTLTGGRFNNVGGQESILILHNAGDDLAHCDVPFWDPDGSMLAWSEVNLAPRATYVLRAADVPGLAGRSGSITVVHDAPYGTLIGKVAAFDPATGFSFDTPLAPKPR